ncbi:hypothetical protein [Methylobacterium frigidaeris]|uniref:Uncharacterized protein n=1 Tax=Methylobacterium frigidaeris TaxID=2038277 RepID=A0AA37M821_9HYPH|nr:hypothetical protein [Methylobacterium frigidaeris]GJD65634.1 hypothetical protein MPEAHAMD_5829 [Methylobacterium frigidaeris]
MSTNNMPQNTIQNVQKFVGDLNDDTQQGQIKCIANVAVYADGSIRSTIVGRASSEGLVRELKRLRKVAKGQIE